MLLVRVPGPAAGIVAGPFRSLPGNASNQDRLRGIRLRRLVRGTVHDKFPIVSVPGGKTNHRTVNGCRMYLLFIIQFVGEFWAKAERAAAPRRIKRPDRQVARPTKIRLAGVALSCVGRVNQSRTNREGLVLSVIDSLIAALLSRVRWAIFHQPGRCGCQDCTAWLCQAERPVGTGLIPSPALHLRAASRAVIRSSRSSAAKVSPANWTDWA